MDANINNLPSIAQAKFPISYTAAKTALAKCNKLDECSEWANKADAMASYAKQADDKSLYNMAVRIRARAIRRCGELLQKIESNKGGRPKKTSVHKVWVSKKAVATKAGLSHKQQHTAQRLSKVPVEEFEEDIESDNPSSIAELAAKGTKKKEKPVIDLEGRDPDEFHLATQARGALQRFAKFAEKADQNAVVRGSFPRERRQLKEWTIKSCDWCERLIGALKDNEYGLLEDKTNGRKRVAGRSKKPHRRINHK